jgi:hypothetical protein
MTDTTAIDRMIALLSRPYGNLTAGERLDAAKMLADMAPLCYQQSTKNYQQPILMAEPAQVTAQAVEALASYQQADMDGVMVLVSRQAIEECLPALRAIAGGKP